MATARSAAKTISPEQFAAIRDRVRESCPAHEESSEPELKRVYDLHREAVRQTAAVLRLHGGHWRRHLEGERTAATEGLTGGGRSTDGPNTLELAVALGDLSRIGRMLRLRQVDPAPRWTESDTSKARHPSTLTINPVEAAAAAVVAGDRLRAAQVRHAGSAHEALPLSILLRAVEDLNSIQQVAGEERKDENGRVQPPVLGRSVIPRDAALLARRGLLALDELPDAFQRGYEKSWHTEPKTRSAAGAFVAGLRERAAREGGPELLTVLAASSDGRNRGVAGIASGTPGPVYDKLIYDNSKGVLFGVAASPQFTQPHAYSMMETNLPNQLAAVMLRGRIDLGIRVLAARKAIAHPGVDPNDIYAFLRDHTANPDVPQALWRDFTLELEQRLLLVRAKGDPETAAAYEAHVEKVASRFCDEVLRRYWNARRKVRACEREGPQAGGAAENRTEAARRYVQAHEFIRDPQLLDVFADAIRSKDRLVAMLRYCVESDVPVSRRLIVKVFRHEDREVRETGMRLMPKLKPEAVAALEAEMQSRIARDYESVKDRVLTTVVPRDYEGIDGAARPLSRMHHYFPAAREIPRDDLVAIYVQCAERDPRTIPEAFRHATLMRRYTSRAVAALADRGASRQARAPEREETPMPPPERMRQADLFGDSVAGRVR